MTARTSDREIVISRVFDAPRDLVFDAWVDPQHVGAWYGPTGFTITTHEMDVRPGGVWRFIMPGPDGTDYPNRILYLEVLNTMTLTEQEGKTTMTISGYPVNATDEERRTFDAGRGSMKQGFTGTLDQLDAYLAKGDRS